MQPIRFVVMDKDVVSDDYIGAASLSYDFFREEKGAVQIQIYDKAKKIVGTLFLCYENLPETRDGPFHATIEQIALNVPCPDPIS